MKTAKELFDKMLEENDECTSTEMMIEFAKLHVIEALKQASEEACVIVGDCGEAYPEIDEKTILNAYNLDEIK